MAPSADEPQEVIGGGAPAPVEAVPSAGSPRERQFYGQPAAEQRAALQQTFNEVAPAVGPGGAGMALGQAGGTMVMRALSRVAPSLAKLPEPILRIIMGAVGQGTGEALFEPEGSFAGGAVRGAVAGAAGEAIGAGATYGSRKLGLTQSPAAKAAAFTAKEQDRVAADTAAAKARAQTLSEADQTRYATEKVAETQRMAQETSAERARVQGANTAEAQRVLRERASVKQQIAGANVAEQQRVASQQATRSGETAQQLGDVARQVAPPLQPQLGPTSAQQLSDVGTFPRTARRDLGRYLETRTQEADGLIGGASIRVPSLGVGPRLSPAEETMIRRQLGLRPNEPIPGLGRAEIAGGQERITLRDATDRLADIGQGVWRAGDATTVRLPRLEQARLYGTVRDEIMAELASHSPAAAAAWDEGRRAFSGGNALISVLNKEKVFDRSPDAAQIDLKGLQQVVRRNAQWLRDRLTPADYRALQGAVFKGQDMATEVATPTAQTFSAANLPPGVSLPAAARRTTAQPIRGRPVTPAQTVAPQPVTPAQAPPPRPIFTPNDYAQIYLNSMLERRLHPDAR